MITRLKELSSIMSNLIPGKKYAIFYALMYFISILLFLGVFFDRYEIVFNALSSGKFTPGLPYNDFFYLAHFGLIKIYSLFYSCFPKVNWVGVIQVFYLFISFLFILLVFIKNKSSKRLTLVLIFFISAIFIEQIVLNLYTRVSFILSFSSLLLYLDSIDQSKQKTNFKILFVSFLFFTIASLTRAEVALLVFIIVLIFYILFFVDFINLKNHVKHLKYLAFFLIPILLIFSWTHFEIKNSQSFYKLIEPDVEYELTARDNIVPINLMTNAVDSMRYLAIDKVMWGDATTNDANFLRSLIENSEDDLFSKKLFQKSLNSIYYSTQNHKTYIYMFMVLIFFAVYSSIRNNKKILFRSILFFLFIVSLIFILSYRIKMTETAISCILFIAIVLLLFLFKKHHSHSKLLTTILIVSSAFFLHFNYKISKYKMEEQKFYEKAIYQIKEKFAGKNILLNGESKKLLFAFKPLEMYNFSPPLHKIIIYDSQHLSTVEPYRTFLANDCNCDPNNYKEYFSYLKKDASNNIFLMSEEFKIFLENYLFIVHHLDIKFQAVNQFSIFDEQENYLNKQLFAYKIVTP